MESEYDQSSDIGLGIFSVLHRADQEIERLKKGSLNTKSKYWKPIRKQDNESSKVGVRQLGFSGGNSRGIYDEWNRGFEWFCNQTVNSKGRKVNRNELKQYYFNKDKFAGGNEVKPNED
tara:strand:- start:260 stop:616 length:357 start_codon:yes stop_codon:yes gene_type:complete